MAQQSTLSIERRSIDHVPPEERHGSVTSLFTIWFAANMQVTTIVTGALATVLGLPLVWGLVAIAVGNLVGAVFMALHSAQGPKLGVPQMIQSRAQFGFYGAILPLLLVILMYLGFFASSGVLGGQALHEWSGLGVDWSIIVVAAVCAVLATFGYRLIHAYERWVSLISGLAFLYLTIRLLTGNAVAWSAGSFDGGTFLLIVAIAATWQIAYAPYVADYSRYLPERTSIGASFWWTYAGSVIATVWMMGFGAIAAAVAQKAFEGGSVAFIVRQAGGVSWLFFAVIILGILAANVLNLYGAFMSSTTTLSALWRLRVGRRQRALFVVGAGVVGTALAIAGRGNFLSNYESFILFLTYVLVPWTAINLVDFYLVRRRRYDIDAIFDPRGRYGAINWRAMAAYALGVAVEIPFVSTSFFTGPVVGLLGGADISWILGLIVSAGAYYALMRPVAARAEAEAGAGRRDRVEAIL